MLLFSGVLVIDLSVDRAYYLSLLWFSFFYVQHVHIGEECELTCRESNNEVVILPSNMTVDSVLREHWRNPHKVKVGLYECLFAPRNSGKRTLHVRSAIHNFPVRNFTCGVNTPVNADRYFTFALNAKHGNPSNILIFFFLFLACDCENMPLSSCITVPNMVFSPNHPC